MPPKQCMCCICGQTVNKCKTYHVGDGKRACREHDGVTDKAQELQAEQKAQAQREAEEAKRRRKAAHAWEGEGRTLAPKCFGCGKVGIRQDAWHLNFLKAIERMELAEENPPHMFHPDFHTTVRKYLRSPDAVDDRELTCLWLIPLDDDTAFLEKRLRYDPWMAMRIMGFGGFCPECVKRLGLQDKLPKPPEMKLENLEMWAVIGGMVKDELRKEVLEEQGAAKP